MLQNSRNNKLCGRPPQYTHAPCDLDLLTFDLASGARVTFTCATSVPILVFLDLSVLEFGPMYATDRQSEVRHTDRQTDVRRQTASLLNAPT